MLLLAVTLIAGQDTIYARGVLDQHSQVNCEFITVGGTSRKKSVIGLPTGNWSVLRFGKDLVISARSSESKELVICRAGAQPESLSLANSLSEMRICDNGKYLLVVERGSQPKQYSTEVFRLSQSPLVRVGTTEGRGVTALAGQVVIALLVGREGVRYATKPLSGELQNNQIGRNILSVASKRQTFWQKDIWRSYGNGDVRPPIDLYSKADGLAVSDDGMYWFEKSLREYVIDGQDSAHFFSGHVLFDRSGMIAQWKFHRDSLHGVTFRKGHLRMFWTEDFLFGNRKLTKYGPGCYDLDIKSMKLEKMPVSTDLLSANPTYFLVP